MWAVDPRRYTDYTDHDYCVKRGWRFTATNTPCISHNTNGPLRATKKLSPVHSAVIAKGGVMGAFNGWNAPIGLPKMVTILRLKQHTLGGVPVLGKRA